MEEAKWYVAHTYSGYENKVKADIEKTIINRNLGDQIMEVMVPTEHVVKVKDGVKKASEQKLFPGYVLVHMIMNDETWYVVRNTRGVTGFVGPGSKPVPLTDAEMSALGVGGVRKNVKIDFEVGDEVVAITGAWRDTVGVIRNINQARQTVTIMVEMFGRETPVELGFTEVKRK
ncbi:MAG: transcription termination/antitermination factor NusG [Lachnospiraceae bacterium]|nr:transcription termination/antitermination factor NusG [Lachnospiraceae bacterium]